MGLDGRLTLRRVGAGALLVFRGVIGERIAAGRLRNVGWPAGWAAMIMVGYLAFAVGVFMVLTAPVWRGGALTEVGDGLAVIPRSVVWLLALLVSVVAALLHVGAVHGPWWARIGSLLVMLAVMVTWTSSLLVLGSPWTLAGVLSMVAMVVVTLLVRRTRPTWWEFVVFWVLLAVSVLVAMFEMGRAVSILGHDISPLLFAQMMTVLTALVLPVAVASGTVVAELTVAATIWTAVAARRVGRRPALLLIFAIALVVRIVQTVLDLSAMELPWDLRLARVAPVVVAVVALAVVSVLLIHRAGTRAYRITQLPVDLTRVALPFGAAIFGVFVPYWLVLIVLQVVAVRTESNLVAAAASMMIDDRVSAGIRGIVAVALLALAFRTASRRFLTLALLEAHIGILLLPSVVSVVIESPWPLFPSPDLMNIAVTLLAVLLTAYYVVTRSLTTARMTGLGALLVLGAVFSDREALVQPLGSVFGPGIALVLLGLVWGLLTACHPANVDGRRFPAAARAPLLLGFIVLTVTVLAFLTLGGGTSDDNLGVAEGFGDSLLGTALLTATVTCLLASLRRNTALR